MAKYAGGPREEYLTGLMHVLCVNLVSMVLSNPSLGCQNVQSKSQGLLFPALLLN